MCFIERRIPVRCYTVTLYTIAMALHGESKNRRDVDHVMYFHLRRNKAPFLQSVPSIIRPPFPHRALGVGGCERLVAVL
ncbi:hypothetical protein BOTBODRAFT_567705 [Botryobasidium botryosum FD-172 SS1]|uniref:Uncharacterized protein n=1 Tax=Botryobasidium botryosum (strain FD-172 SS1) TaxID=930990 RepID=A0A067LYD1_BOTB1|nr:hypothetical protein BOTBODRAFT_567705 [Botryobasidium botryosum FD-172 SS1]